MKIKVPFKNPRTGEVKLVKVGWSWTLFFFASILGIPLFIRKLNFLGAIFLVLWLAIVIVPNLMHPANGIPTVLAILSLVLSIWIAIKGNEKTAKNYLNLGWVFAEPHSDATRFGKLRWGIAGDDRNDFVSPKEPSF